MLPCTRRNRASRSDARPLAGGRGRRIRDVCSPRGPGIALASRPGSPTIKPDMRLRLYHHPDGTRVAYRERGAGPALALIHSAMLSHKEWEPSVEQLAAHFRVVLPDLPLHGDSEDSPKHPYTLDWFAEVLGGFAADVLGPSPLIGGSRRRRRGRAAGRRKQTNQAQAARADVKPSARPTRARPLALGLARGDDGRRDPRDRPPRRLRDAHRLQSRARFAAVRTRQPRRARSAAPRLRRRSRQRRPGPLVGEVRPRLAERGARGSARAVSAPGHARAAAVGRSGSPAPDRHAPRPRCACSPTRSCGCCRAPAF